MVVTIHSINLTAPRTYILKHDKGNMLEGGLCEQEVNKKKYGYIN